MGRVLGRRRVGCCRSRGLNPPHTSRVPSCARPTTARTLSRSDSSNLPQSRVVLRLRTTADQLIVIKFSASCLAARRRIARRTIQSACALLCLARPWHYAVGVMHPSVGVQMRAGCWQGLRCAAAKPCLPRRTLRRLGMALLRLLVALAGWWTPFRGTQAAQLYTHVDQLPSRTYDFVVIGGARPNKLIVHYASF